MFGRDIEAWTGEAIRWRKLSGKKKGEEELGFAGAAVKPVLALVVNGDSVSRGSTFLL